jgi:hypothetical protein
MPRCRRVEAHTLTAASLCSNLARPCSQPFEPLPDLAFHAPILPTYPPSATVEEDAALGCHQGALYPPDVRRLSPSMQRACLLSKHRILTFLDGCGVPLRKGAAGTSIGSMHGPSAHTELASTCLSICEEEASTHSPSCRSAHAAGGVGTIVRRAWRRDRVRLLNRHHECLLELLNPSDLRLADRGDSSCRSARDQPADFILAVIRPEAERARSSARSPRAPLFGSSGDAMGEHSRGREQSYRPPGPC